MISTSFILICVRGFSIALASALAVSCASATAPSPDVSLSGTWSGRLGAPQSGSALRLTWVATQTGTTVSGAATVVKPAANVPATGTMSGTLSGSQLTLTYSVPSGSVPIYVSCTISGSGTATATQQAISGNLQLTFTSCLGSGLEPTDSSQLSLTRQ